MNVYDPYGYYPDAALVGGVFRDEEKNQYVVEDPLGLNLYTYCHNNPTMFTDPLGKFVITTAMVVGAIVGGVSGAGLGALGAKISGTSILGGAIGGAVSGIFTALFPGGSILKGAALAFAGSGIGSLVEGLFNDEFDIMDAIWSAGLGGIFGAFSGKLGKLMEGSFSEIGEKVAGGFIDWIFGHVETSVSAIKDMLFPKKSYAS